MYAMTGTSRDIETEEYSLSTAIHKESMCNVHPSKHNKKTIDVGSWRVCLY